MKHFTCLVFSFFIISSNLIAQTIISGVVKDSLDKPIPFATVCLLRTTIGTSTDIDGQYSLKIPQQGFYQLFAASVGYNSTEQNINAEGKNQTIDLKLSINDFKINEVTIKASNSFKKKYYNLFVKQFIGDTHNSLGCTILNPEDLHLYKDSKTNVLKGFSIKPLRIENKALGYTIVYDLTDFSFDPKTEIFKFAGNNYFQALAGSDSKSKKWEKNRLFAYYGSRMHFIRSLFVDSLSNEYYKIFEDDQTSDDLEIHLDVVLQKKELVFPHSPISKKFFYRRPILISFTNNHPELVYSPYGFIADEFKTLLVFTDSVNIYQNGMFENPYAIRWEGAMAKERVADMLPFDYHPYNKNTDSYSNQLLSKKKKLNDQVFVQTDRNLYSPGDTIYFQAYIRNRISGEFESASNSLYALLFNEQKEIADSSRFKIENAVSSGWMVVPNTAISGKYRFVAFTGMMQNEDPNNVFQLDLRVDSKLNVLKTSVHVQFNKEYYLPGDSIEATIQIANTKHNPVQYQNLVCNLRLGNSSTTLAQTSKNEKGESVFKFIMPNTLDNLVQLQVEVNKNTNHQSITKDFTIPCNDQFIDFRLLPEGGTLAEGLEQKIGFNATNRKGEPLYIEGALKGKNGWLIDSIKSGKYGPGSIVTTPEKGMYIELTNGEYKNKIYPLPEFNSSGMCISVRPENKKSIAVDVQSNKYNGDTVLITATMNQNNIFSQRICLNEMKRLILETDELPAGALQINLFDATMIPVAERLVYINADKHLKFNITSDAISYNPGDETELAISVSDGQNFSEKGIFSIAVVDAATGSDAEIFAPGIDYIFNYYPYIAQNLPPKVLLQGIENLSDEERDLILMVYGWSKIHLETDLKDTINKLPVNYDLLNMKILYALNSRMAERKLKLMSLEGLSMKHLLTDNNGEISLPLDSLSNETYSVILMPDVKNKTRVSGGLKSGQFGDQNLLELLKRKTVWGLKLSIPCKNDFFNSANFSKSIPSIQLKDSIANNPANNFSMGDSIIEISEIEITANSKRQYNDEYEKMLRNTYVHNIANEPLWDLPSMYAAVRKLSPSAMTSVDDYIILNPNVSNNPAYVVLDGEALNSRVGWTTISKIRPDKLKSLTIQLDGSGVIFVSTLAHDHNPKLEKKYSEWQSKSLTDDLLVPFKIYRAYREFYNPTKAELNIDPLLQERPTIYWKSEVYFDGKEPVKIKFPNLNRKGEVVVTINGVSANNLMGTGKFHYQVKK